MRFIIEWCRKNSVALLLQTVCNTDHSMTAMLGSTEGKIWNFVVMMVQASQVRHYNFCALYQYPSVAGEVTEKMKEGWDFLLGNYDRIFE
ncbi:hypothetical protein [Aliamphritea spongicola]|uniref:hypothetical protein n=1 Tax=Aliamphritea spongicola TaxID=707589 RepID=UPI00196A3EB0|nr:hypothetical protein [Aliamphritea spongicola]MBN3561889.1 hypothetical protein [Aliamphritea spongicola]